jgi:gas vesicle protein
MNDEKKQDDIAPDEHRSKHPFAYGALAGAAVGVGVGLLVAPRKGSELRHELGNQLAHAKTSCASGLNRAKDKVSDWSHKGGDAYRTTRKAVGTGAHKTRRYLGDVADAVTMKSRREAEAVGRQTEPAQKSQAEPVAMSEKSDVTSSTRSERPRPSLAAKSS